jgi:hypothetical protein
MVLDLVDSGFQAGSRKIQGERVFGANAFAKRFDDLEPKLKSLMSDQEFTKLKAMRNDAEDLMPPAGAVPKGSAGFFIDALNKMGVWSLLDKVPGVGAILSNEVQKLGRSARSEQQLKRALQKPRTKEAENLISSEYPALAAILLLPGAAAADEEE